MSDGAWLNSRDSGHHWIMSASLLWVIAAILVIAGIVVLLQGSVLLGIVLIVLGLLVGPGGVSMFSSRRV